MKKKVVLIPLILSFTLYSISFYIGSASAPYITQSFSILTPVPWYNIFLHNFIADVTIFSGIITYGTVTFISLFIQGLVHGASWSLSPMTPLSKFLNMIPHGIFEIPAILLAGYVGFYPLARRIFIFHLSWTRIALLMVISIVLLLIASLVEERVWRQI